MATRSNSDSRRMYSWWWDSHISPKNSKWLQENLTDMDAKVKIMIKLIEEDADSFARRAEMYYKKRPELMRMVEEFYRAYRALAERYDHATGVIRHAHRTMAEAFPNQDPSIFADDLRASLGTDPRTPEISTSARSLNEIDEMSNVSPGLASSNYDVLKTSTEFTVDSGIPRRRRDLKQFKDPLGPMERVRKGLNFDKMEDKEQATDVALLKHEKAREPEEILMLKEAISKLENEKEADLVKYQQSLDKLSHLESEISQTRENFRVFSDRATKAENEVIILKESLSKLETEKNFKLQEYQKCLEKLSDLETSVSLSREDANKLNQRAVNAETEAQSCKVECDRLAAAKDDALNQYMQSLEIISNLESKLRRTEEDATRLKERAENAESEVETLMQTISKLNDEKETAALEYQRCLEMISSLEHKLSCAQEETKLLNVAIDGEVSKLKGAKEQCLELERSNKSLQSELNFLMLKTGTQTHELTEKQKELGKLWAQMQEERMKFIEAEISFQTLQHLHAQTQEELQSMAHELQKGSQLLKVSENHNQNLQDDVLKVKEENKHLDQLNASSSLSMREMENEISTLKESKGKLEKEVELHLDQRNALQHEIYSLKEELIDVDRKHLLVLNQVHMVGLKPESFGSSVKELQDENSNLKQTCQKEKILAAALLEKLETFEQLLEKNSVLETSLSDLHAELEAVRGKIEALEQSIQSLLMEKSTLLDDKATLMTILQETEKNFENLSGNNIILVNSLSDCRSQLETFKCKSKQLEDACQSLETEKTSLTNKNDCLMSQLEGTQITLKDLEKIYGELEGRYKALEKERDINLSKAMQLQLSLEVERQEHSKYIQISDSKFMQVEAGRHLLYEECQWRKGELDKALDTAIANEIEIFLLCKIAKELELNNFVLQKENQKLEEESTLSGRIISQLKMNNAKQLAEIKSLSDQASNLKTSTSQLMEFVGIVHDPKCMDKSERHQVYFNQLLCAIRDMKLSLCKAEEENQQWAVEFLLLITWIRQLRFEAQNVLRVEKDIIEHELKERTEQLSAVQRELLKHLEINEEFRVKLMEGDSINEALLVQIERLQRKLIDMQGTCTILQGEKSEVYEEKKSLNDKLLLSEEKNRVLEEENNVLCGEVLALNNLSLIFRNCAEERFMAVRELDKDLSKLHDVNMVLMKNLRLGEDMSEELKIEVLQLRQQVRKSEDEMKIVATIKDQLSDDFENEKNLLYQIKLELQDAERKIGLIEKEKFELHRMVEDLKLESHEVKIIRDDQENQILKLSNENEHLLAGADSLREASQILEIKNQGLNEELNKSKMLGEIFKSELKKKTDEIDEMEVHAASVFGQLQYSTILQLLIDRKFQELGEVCFTYIDENEDLKNQLASFGPEIVSLKERVASMENHADLHIKHPTPENEVLQSAEVRNESRATNLNQDEDLTSNALSDLQDLHARLQAIEKASVVIKELMVQENIDLRSKLNDSVRQVEELKSVNGHYHKNFKQRSEISEADDSLLTKDIMLDQISNGSPYGLSQRETIEVDNQSVGLWGTADPDGLTEKILSPAIFNDTDLYSIHSTKKGKLGASDKPIDEQLSVDNLEISKRFNKPIQEGNKKKVLDRLDSDVQKLANLQITVQDLKRKLQVVETGKRGKDVIACESLKGQLEEADIAIMKLFDFNGRLTKTVENGSFADVKSSFDFEGDRDARSRVPEQARRMSEKIGRLQLEVQKLQFVLLKLNDKKDGKSTMPELKRRVLLRDYLYGGRRGQGSKAQFCGCMQPSTVDD